MTLVSGEISTNKYCVGCNRCMTSCPVHGANMAGERTGLYYRRLEVDNERCVRCGYCLSACRHLARDYGDDTEQFWQDLTAGRPLSLAVDPSFFIMYPDQGTHILGYLKRLGIRKIYDISLGGELCAWATLNFMQEHNRGVWYTSHCSSVVDLIEKNYPHLLNRLLPVQTPLMCLAVYVSLYLKDNTPLVYLGPCLSKKLELEHNNPAGNVRYAVTYRNLFRQLRGLDLKAYEAQPDLASADLGYLYDVSSGVKDLLSYFLSPEIDLPTIDDFCHAAPRDEKRCQDTSSKENLYCQLVNVRSCVLGCNNSASVPEGSGISANIPLSLSRIYRKIAQRADYPLSRKERAAGLNQKFAGLNLKDFARTFVDRYRQPFRLPADVLNDIFNAMGKRDAASRNLNCGFCGYPTCREMARAIGFGTNRIENCIHYTRQEALRLYQTDMLTGMPNLLAFKQAASNLFWQHPDQKYLLAYFDIKNFKVLNDLYGFAAGDQVLQQVARSIQDFVKDNGACARIMSDHFIICLPDTPDNIQQIIYHCSHAPSTLSLDFPISFDLGFYRITDPTLPLEQMLDWARMAQMTIKGSYDVRWAFYDAKMREQKLNESWVTREMQKSLQNQEFQVYLQPKYNYRTQSIIGAEALSRWQHPQKGLIPPSLFIPVLEENQFICQLDAYVRDHTCSLLRQWQDKGLKVVPVSVNLSRLDLYDEKLPFALEELLHRLQLPPSLLHLEVTESAYTQHPQQLLTMLGTLHKMGFTIEMDDFGSGYSSLNILHQLPIDVVKLDLRFLSGSRTPKSRNILTAVSQMMKLLQLPLVAEGVETAEQADFLASIQCYIIQGYFYARPMPAADFEKQLRLCQPL